MKKNLLGTILFAGAATLMAGCSSDDGDVNISSLPSEIQTFVTRYWPNTAVETYTAKKGTYEVELKYGPEISFDSDYSWTEIDGQGMPLPQILIYDQLPSTLYSYLEETSNTENVFEVERNAIRYKVELLSSELTYTIATEKITEQFK